VVQETLAPRSEPSSAAADQRRREILAAASKVFRRKGFAATGMREIAAELGMTAGNLYYYFRGKEELLAFCQQTTLDDLLGGAEEILALGLPSTESLRRMIVAHVVCLNETYPGSLAHLEIETLGPALRAPLEVRRKRYERLLIDRVAAGTANGELRASDPGLAVRALLGALNWTVKWFSPQGAKSATEVGEELAELLLGGLGKAPS